MRERRVNFINIVFCLNICVESSLELYNILKSGNINILLFF